MSLASEIARIALPVAGVGGIGLFIVLRMKHKYKKGTLGKKKTKSAQQLLDSLIPFGMMFGLAIAIFLSLFTPFPLLSTITWGPGIGMLLGYFAYEVYSKKKDRFS